MKKRSHRFIALIVFCVVMSCFTSQSVFVHAENDSVYQQIWSINTKDSDCWKIAVSDPFNPSEPEKMVDGVSSGGIRVTEKSGYLNISKPSSDNYPCVRLKYSNPISLDMRSAKYLHYSLESNSSFKIAINYIYGQINSPDEFWKKKQEVMSKWISGNDMDNPAGTYKSLGVSIQELNKDNVDKFLICSIDIWLVGNTTAHDDCNLLIKDFGLYNRKPIAGINCSTADISEWECNEGQNYSQIDNLNDDLILQVVSDNSDSGSNYICYENKKYSQNNPAIINLKDKMIFDYSLYADNVFDISFLLKNPQTGKIGKFKLNKYLAFLEKGNYSSTVYGDEKDCGYIEYTEKLSLNNMIEIEILNKDDQVTGWGFTIPDNGIVELYEIRCSAQWIPVSQGINLRKLCIYKICDLGDANADNIINIKDLVKTKKFLSREDENINMGSADIDRNSIINATDVSLIRKRLLNNECEFSWGISGHNFYYASYPKSTLEQQISLASELGTNIYRFNFTPDFNSSEQMQYLDDVVRLCEEKGLKLFLILFDKRITEEDNCEYFTNYCKALSEKYRGQISYYQLSNEQDIQCMCEDSTGEYRKNYDIAYTKVVSDRLNAMKKGIKQGDPEAKISINISYKHTYFLNLLLENGMDWDISGLDWYSNMGDPTPTINNLLAFPAYDIFVSEINTWGGNNDFTDAEQKNYIKQMSDFFHKYGRVKAFMIYELLDEPTLQGVEKSFGLVECDRNGNIGKKKPIFDFYKELIIKNK